MTVSRRELAALLPALSASAQEAKTPGAISQPVLRSTGYDFEKLPVRANANGTMKSRSVFDGVTTRGQRVTMHISELAPGQAPHPPARQPHDEVIVIREGTLEVTLNGEKSILGPGSVIFSAYNNLTGWKNVGTTPVQYYVLALEEHQS